MSARHLTLRHLCPPTLGPYVAGLRALEQGIRYPLDDASFFTLDHGPLYHPFFSGLGEAHFLLALNETQAGSPEVVGTVAGIRKEVRLEGRDVQALYVADLKLRSDFRGQRLARRMCLRGLWELVRDPSLRQARLLYGAAMRGKRGDVMRTVQGAHPFRLGRPLATLGVWFTPPERLAKLEPSSAPSRPARGGWNLSPHAPFEGPGVASTAGKKDLRRVPDGAPLPLHHLPVGPNAWPPNLGHYLRTCGEWLVSQGSVGQACFALDTRLSQEHAWLTQQKLPPDTACTVYALALPPHFGRPPWVHLATSEI